ncbi:DUF3300 domain-containing protein [Rhodanobacter sp. Si-c]|uniref:DUF3300 domain-containing protein n=1 Tax=Rhodanobacter lycopersici TaxID=3162487 RepID=A0ABV3QF36_9GAMM
MIDRTPARNAACALLCAGAVMLAGCSQSPNPQAANPAAAGTAPAAAGSTAQQSAPYTPPTADQLYQMVAPIALFPDKLVAQVLAGSTYPDQITAADNMLQQQPGLKGAQLASAVDPQPWDPSVKGLTQFPSVLDQMAQNIQWTTALGETYVNDPSDVMNAIQVMRERAASKGSLRSSSQMQVVSQAAAAPSDEESVADENAPPEYAGPAVVPAPGQTIEILPAQSDTVYVPQYDPETVYGEPVEPYPGYTYVQPSGYSTGQIVATGAIAFGVGIVVGALFEHHHDGGPGPGPNPGWGWNSWGMNWGGRGGRPGGPGGGGWRRPAVVHNNTVYVSRSNTVVNRYTTHNINNSRTVNYLNSNNRTTTGNPGNRGYSNVGNRRAVNGRAAGAPAAMPGQVASKPAAQPMTMPHFGTPVRGAEPARFAHGSAPAQPGRPQSPRSQQRTESPNPPMARRAPPAPAARAPQAAPPVQRAVAHEAPHGVARPQPHPAPVREAPPRPAPVHAAAAPRPVEHAPLRPAPHPAAARPEPASHANAHPAPPAHRGNGKAQSEDKKRKATQQH